MDLERRGRGENIVNVLMVGKVGVMIGDGGSGKHATVAEWFKAADLRSAHSLSCLLYTSPSPRDQRGSRMPSSA